jgi:hypothetical protein
MSFKGTPNREGRPKGTPNKNTKEIREAFKNLIEDNIDQMTKDLKQLEPKDRLKFIIDLSTFVIPKLKQADINIDTDKNFNPVTISFSDVEMINKALESKY